MDAPLSDAAVTVFSLGAIALLLAIAALFQNAVPQRAGLAALRLLQRSWHAAGEERRWRAIMLAAISVAVFGAYYRSDDYETQRKYLYDTLIRQHQLVIGAGLVAAISAYFWLGSFSSTRRGR